MEEHIAVFSFSFDTGMLAKRVRRDIYVYVLPDNIHVRSS